MNSKDKMILTLECDGKRFIAEHSWDASIEELLQSFYAHCISVTYSPKTVLRAMREFSNNEMEALFPDEIND